MNTACNSVTCAITEVPNLVCESLQNSFRQELAAWWSLLYVKMGKAAKIRDNDSAESSTPPKLTKEQETAASSSQGGQQAGTGAANRQSQGDMLTVLTGISGILKDGFESLNKKVSTVGDNIDKMEENLLQKFNDFGEHYEEESEEDEPQQLVIPQNGGNDKRKRQDKDVLSSDDEEVVQPGVLDEATNALDCDDTVGPPVKEYVATFVKKAFEKPITGDTLRKYKDKFPTPSNIDCLDVPILNEPIYLKLSSTAKNEDRAIQGNQATFLKVVKAMVKVTDMLADHEKEGDWVKEAIKVSSEGITLAAALKKDWLKARREDVKPALPEDFKTLASVKIPLTAKNLFGDDLEGSIKSVENTNKIAKKMETKKKSTAGQQKTTYKGPYKKKRKYNNNNNNNKNNNNNSGGSGSSSYEKKKDYKDKKDFHKRGSRN